MYLGDENETSVDQPSTSNGINDNSTASSVAATAAPTFLMYNKISTTITGKESPTPSTTNGGGSLNGNDNQKTSKSDKKKNDKNRESAIWYVN